MRHGSLFSGIGGFDLASEWMGWENVFHCEWMEFPRKVLKYYWPKAISYENICTTDFSIHRGDIDIITGGFPCQPYSMAGKRLGKEDERHLWPEMLRAIREIEPSWVVGENVRGLTNWNGGVVFEEVCADLENLGYEVQPVLLPACAVGAPHRRDRIWFIAYSNKCTTRPSRTSRGIESKRSKNNDEQKLWGEQTELNTGSHELLRNASDTDSNGQHRCNSEHEINASQGRINAFDDIEQINVTKSKSIRQEYALENRELERKRFGQSNKRNAWDSFPSQSPICGGDDGLSTELDGITFPKWRNESIKGEGNAIVPQVAYQIFKVIEQLKQRQ